jgi:hypothetical protein
MVPEVLHGTPSSILEVSVQCTTKKDVFRFFCSMVWKYTWEVAPGHDNTDNFGKWIKEFDPWDHPYFTEALGDLAMSASPIFDFSGFECCNITQNYQYKYDC